MIEPSSDKGFEQWIATELTKRREANLYRIRTPLLPDGSRYVVRQKKKLLNFSSNDYLGLAYDKRVIAASSQAVASFGAGGTSSQLVAGHQKIHEQLESELASFLGREAALVFPSGFMMNLGLVQSLVNRKDAVISDKLNHASLLDAVRLSQARHKRYRHLDAGQCGLQLQAIAAESRRQLVVSDGVFSMDGDIAPISELVVLCRDSNRWLMIDDAHGIGVLGGEGRGSVAEQYSQAEVPVLTGTFGKSFGANGGFVVGSRNLIEYCLQACRSYIYTTALAPSLTVAALTSLRLIVQESWRRRKLAELVDQFQTGVKTIGSVSPQSSQTAIQPLIFGTASMTVAVRDLLLEKGFYVQAIRPPTVPDNSSRLRITLTAAHEPEDVNALLSALAIIVEKVSLA